MCYLVGCESCWRVRNASMLRSRRSLHRKQRWSGSQDSENVQGNSERNEKLKDLPLSKKNTNSSFGEMVCAFCILITSYSYPSLPFPSPSLPLTPSPSFPLEVPGRPLKYCQEIWGMLKALPAGEPKPQWRSNLALKSDIWWHQFD